METLVKSSTPKNAIAAKKKLAIVTCCLDDWGGSEDLWFKAAIHLREQGFEIMILKQKINLHHSKFVELLQKKFLLKELDTFPRKSAPKRLFIKAWNKVRKHNEDYIKTNFENQLRQFQPHHVLISQGINFDGLMFAHSCMRMNLSYSIVSQKAVEFYWPQPNERAVMKQAFEKAAKCFFVSQHNLQLTEEQFGFRFYNAKLVWNPVKVKREIIAYPSVQNGFNLACIGRLFILDKGQDILLRILSQKKWKERPLTISFVGNGVDEAGLKSMADLLNVKNIEFTGQQQNIEDIWKQHHALVLPSRSEGRPLVILEAMAAGRMTIATNVGGNDELIADEKSGFIAEANFSSFDAALEKAWQRRNEWEAMGKNAFHDGMKKIPEAPEIDFAQNLMNLIYE